MCKTKSDSMRRSRRPPTTRSNGLRTCTCCPARSGSTSTKWPKGTGVKLEKFKEAVQRQTTKLDGITDEIADKTVAIELSEEHREAARRRKPAAATSYPAPPHPPPQPHTFFSDGVLANHCEGEELDKAKALVAASQDKAVLY